MCWSCALPLGGVERAGLKHKCCNLQRQIDKFIEMILSAKSPEVTGAYEISERIAKLDIPVPPL